MISTNPIVRQPPETFTNAESVRLPKLINRQNAECSFRKR